MVPIRKLRDEAYFSLLFHRRDQFLRGRKPQTNKFSFNEFITTDVTKQDFRLAWTDYLISWQISHLFLTKWNTFYDKQAKCMTDNNCMFWSGSFFYFLSNAFSGRFFECSKTPPLTTKRFDHVIKNPVFLSFHFVCAIEYFVLKCYEKSIVLLIHWLILSFLHVPPSPSENLILPALYKLHDKRNVLLNIHETHPYEKKPSEIRFIYLQIFCEMRFLEKIRITLGIYIFI